MEFKAMSALTNLGLLQANTGGWGNIFLMFRIVSMGGM
jgi:hypothetical protein